MKTCFDKVRVHPYCEIIERRGDGFSCRYKTLFVIVSESSELDGKRWLHLSISHRNRLPSWDSLKDAKDFFIGEDKLALQVLPPKERYINIHPYVLHLWHCLDGDPVPDFAHGGTSI